MDAIKDSLMGLGNFALYFACALVLLLIFKFVYVRLTPHDEWKLVKEEQNVAAAIGYVGAIIGFCLALASAASNSVSLVDFAIWGVVALIAQALAFLLVRFLFIPSIVERINNDEVSAGVVLAGMSIAVGLLNAACITY
jgi:putative membrane protein